MRWTASAGSIARVKEASVSVADVDTGLGADLDELAGLDRGRQRCECDHGDDDGYSPCGRKAKWRVTIDCTCGENHPRTVELLCGRCLRTARDAFGREAITARRL